jgi:peroxiredoxin
LQIWAIGGEDDDYETLSLFEHQMGLTFPILYDHNIEVQKAFYKLEMVIWSPYPKDFIVGVDGTIRYVNNKFDSEEIMLVVDEELAKMKALQAQDNE